MPKSRFNVSIQYFIYFAILGIFLPYFNLYCHRIGFSSMQIGAIASLKTCVTIVFPLLWGVVADRFGIRKKIFIFVNFVSCGLWSLFFFSDNFIFMMAVMFFYSVFHAPIISFLEAFTVDILGREKPSYGKIRLWGSIGFIISVFLTGHVSDIFGISIVVYMIFAGSFIHALLSTSIPNGESVENSKKGLDLSFFLKPEALLFLFASIIMLGSHSPYYAFYSIYLSDNGLANIFIGISWGIAVVTEIVMMHKSDVIFSKIKPYPVLVFSMFAAALRWFILFFFTNHIIILASQALHCFSYATFHMASILYIDQLTPDGQKTTGQAVNNALGYGLGLLAGNLLSGYFYDIYGGRLLFGGAGVAALAGGVLLCFSGMAGKRIKS